MECSKKRESNLEMLRIVAMLLIVAQHIVERGVEGGGGLHSKSPFLLILLLQ